MTNNPKITVIVPTYNRASTLPRAIDSILTQTLPALEVIVVDDGSTDNTTDVLSKYESIRVLRQDNKGVSAARNYGASEARGDWLAFLDSDDEWLPKKLELQSKAILDNPECPLIHGEEIWIRNGKRVNPMNKHKKYGGRIFQHCVPLCCVSPSASVIKKDLYDELGGFREDYPVCEDYDLWLKICARYDVAFVEEPVLKKYGGHDDQLSRKYFAMDYWRVKSLSEHLESPLLDSIEQTLVRDTLRSKCEILLSGYKKHDNLTHFNEVDSLRWRTL